jgi:hypothetical protein
VKIQNCRRSRLQEQELERLGSNRTHQVDVRLVAATNRNLAEMAKQGKFRRDLYYRLDVMTILKSRSHTKSAERLSMNALSRPTPVAMVGMFSCSSNLHSPNLQSRFIGWSVAGL